MLSTASQSCSHDCTYSVLVLERTQFSTANTFATQLEVLIFKQAKLHSLANHFGQQLSKNLNFLKQKENGFYNLDQVACYSCAAARLQE